MLIVKKRNETVKQFVVKYRSYSYGRISREESLNESSGASMLLHTGRIITMYILTWKHIDVRFSNIVRFPAGILPAMKTKGGMYG